MNPAHIHLALNHVPVVAVIIGVLLLGIGLGRHSADLVRAGLVTFVVAAVLTLPVFFSGEGAEDVVEDLPGVTEHLVEEHEEAGEAAAIAFAVLGVVALGVLVLYRRDDDVPQHAVLAALVVGLVVGVLMVRAANLGGQIRHTEIRAGGKVAQGDAGQ